MIIEWLMSFSDFYRACVALVLMCLCFHLLKRSSDDAI